MKRTAPAKYHEELTPRYRTSRLIASWGAYTDKKVLFTALYCRRPILDAGYYACLHKPNVELNWKGVQEVTKAGLLLEDGTEEVVDVIIMSTGFITVSQQWFFLHQSN